MNAARAGILDALAAYADGIITMEQAAQDYERRGHAGWAAGERNAAMLEAIKAEDSARVWWAWRDAYGIAAEYA